jgi:hypothetical protein
MAISSVISSLREVPTHLLSQAIRRFSYTVSATTQFSSLPIDALPSDKVLLNVGDVVIKVQTSCCSPLLSL